MYRKFDGVHQAALHGGINHAEMFGMSYSSEVKITS